MQPAWICKQLKVIVLTAVVVGAFAMSTICHTHIETSITTRVIVAAVVLLFMYALIVCELVNRSLAALIGAAVSVSVYDCLVELVEMEQIIEWEDLETLSLLFGMMLIVGVLARSGLFEFLAIWAYKCARGRFWTLVGIMMCITAILSALIDNVSTMLLMSTTLIKLSELEQIDPRYLLMIMVLVSNIGGCATPVGDPPNLIIINDEFTVSLGIGFGEFCAYAVPCVILCVLIMMLYLRCVYGDRRSFRGSLGAACDAKFYEQNLNSQTLPANNATSPRGSQRLNFVDAVKLFEPNPNQATNIIERVVDQRDVQQQHQRELTAMMCIDDKLKELCAERETIELADIMQRVGAQVQRLQFQLQGDCVHSSGKVASGAFTRVLTSSIERPASYCSNTRTFGDLSARHSDRSMSTSSSLQNDVSVRIRDLENAHAIKSKAILWQSLIVLICAVVLFVLQSLPGLHLSLGWISLFAGLTLLVLSSSVQIDAENNDDGDSSHNQDAFDKLVGEIEWPTLIFFFGLFIVMEVMSKLGLIMFLGDKVVQLIEIIPSGTARSIGAITIILWASGIASSCIDNVPFTSMMIKVLAVMARASAASGEQLNTKSLIFALAFGACLGGNGTLIGASANLVTAGIADKHNYRLTFNKFFKFAAPITILTLLVANIYLIVVFEVLNL